MFHTAAWWSDNVVYRNADLHIVVVSPNTEDHSLRFDMYQTILSPRRSMVDTVCRLPTRLRQRFETGGGDVDVG